MFCEKAYVEVKAKMYAFFILEKMIRNFEDNYLSLSIDCLAE